MNSERDSADDLPVLARRGGLSDGEQRRFHELLASSPEVRLLYDAGCAFDQEAPVLAGDDELIERIARRVQRGREIPRRKVHSRQVVQSLAFGMLIAGVAIAAVEVSKSVFGWGVDGAHRGPTAVQGGQPSAQPPARKQRALQREQELPALGQQPAPPAPSFAPQEPSAPPVLQAPQHSLLGGQPSEPMAPGPAAAAPLSTPQPSTARFADTPGAEPAAGSSAAELFAAANRARVRGDARQAIALSQQLETLFPKSNEAVTAHLSLGMLYLQQGEPNLALREFRLYRGLGTGSNMAEALWGEAQALRQLGRVSEERTVLEELLQRYPASAFAAAAQKRLAALR